MHGCINRRSLSGKLSLFVARINFRQIQTAPHERFNIALLVGQRTSGVHVIGNTRVTSEITIDVLLSLAARHANLLCQTKCRHAVNQAKVNRFGLSSLIGTHILERHIEYFGSSRTVNIELVREGM